MSRADELRALADVEERLRERFPELDADVVEAAVRVSYSQLTGGVRDFVPLLVEHSARDRLSFAIRENARGDSEPEPGVGPDG
ncbi:three-helix bundle dimerization domain-containing protein [Terrabacter sp. MAHUQ-38]|uniref:three-helix bundle dimerization domain-containing protein n=1 Tax=unclassified Terrabacter TaxID=2630222 RepID=UPI00165DB9BE|nr:hypothetical protein [Terrabacter sp. MAHUQ-38]MBC9821137.1 hypothetical protein [Terrabacter sp. MAHUQ-38]